MKICILTQSEGEPPTSITSLVYPSFRHIHLTYKEKVPGVLYFPRSTWTEGRNRLREEALKQSEEYDYYIFMDSDAVFKDNDWDHFLELLEKYRPLIGVPAFPWHPSFHERLNASVEAQTVRDFDAMVNAFSNSAFRANAILPYYSCMDKVSWWISQKLLIESIAVVAPGCVVQFNSVTVENPVHTTYPTFGSIGLAVKWFERSCLSTCALMSYKSKKVVGRLLNIQYSPSEVTRRSQNIIKNKLDEIGRKKFRPESFQLRGV